MLWPWQKHWIVTRTIWPYKDGYGTYDRKTHTVLDTGLTREEAQLECAVLNHETIKD